MEDVSHQDVGAATNASLTGAIEQLPVEEGDIVVRTLRHTDAEAFALGTKDPAVRAYGHLPLPDYTSQVVHEQIDGVIADGLADGSLAVLAIADATTDQFLGSLVLFDVRQGRAEVGFWLAPEGRGRGAARKALVAGLTLARHAGLGLLDARTAPENAASLRVLESAGFRQQGGPVEQETPAGAVVPVLTLQRTVSG